MRAAGLGVATLALVGCSGWDGAVSTSPAGPTPSASAVPPTTGREETGLAPGYAGPGAWSLQNDATTITLVKGASVERLVTAFAGSGAPRFGSTDEAMRWVDADPYRRTWVAVGVVDGWGFGWEDNDFQGSTDAMAERLSQGTTYASFFWNVNLLMHFTVARDGRLVRSFELVDGPAAGGVGAPLPQEAGMDWQTVPPAGLVLLAKVTGVPVADETWPARPGTVVVGVTRKP